MFADNSGSIRFSRRASTKSLSRKKEIIQSSLDVILRTRRGRRISFTTPADVSLILGRVSREQHLVPGWETLPSLAKDPSPSERADFIGKGTLSYPSLVRRFDSRITPPRPSLNKVPPPPPLHRFRLSLLAVYRPGLRSPGLSAIIFPRSFSELVDRRVVSHVNRYSRYTFQMQIIENIYMYNYLNKFF